MGGGSIDGMAIGKGREELEIELDDRVLHTKPISTKKMIGWCIDGIYDVNLFKRIVNDIQWQLENKENTGEFCYVSGGLLVWYRNDEDEERIMYCPKKRKYVQEECKEENCPHFDYDYSETIDGEGDHMYYICNLVGDSYDY